MISHYHRHARAREPRKRELPSRPLPTVPMAEATRLRPADMTDEPARVRSLR